MENAVDALKIAFAVFVFIAGLASLFYMSSLCVETSRVLITASDETEYYTYLESDTNLVDQYGNRIVEFEDIIPAIYRYAEENYAVTIIDNGEIVARFDLDTERAVNDWMTWSDDKKKELLEYFNDNILKDTYGCSQYNESLNENNGYNDLVNLFKKLYSQNRTNTVQRDYYCYWAATDGYTAQRIDSDLSGIYVTFSLTTKGAQSTTGSNSDIVSNHIPCLGEGNDGLIEEYKDATFTEYIVKVDDNVYVTNDGESLFAFGGQKSTVKREIIYVKN